MGANFATKLASAFQYMFHEIKIQWKVLAAGNGLPRRFAFHSIHYYYPVWTFVNKRSSNVQMYLRTLLRSSSSILKLVHVIDKFATNLGATCWKVTRNWSSAIIILVSLLAQLYLAGENTFEISEVGKIVDVKVKRKEFVLSKEAKELFAQIHDDWEMNVCKTFDNDSLVSG